MGDPDDLMPILKKLEFGKPRGNQKCKKEAERGRCSSQRSKVVVKEESEDFDEATPPASLIAEQVSMKKVRTTRGTLLKEIAALWGALLVGLNNIIAIVDKLQQNVCEELDV